MRLAGLSRQLLCSRLLKTSSVRLASEAPDPERLHISSVRPELLKYVKEAKLLFFLLFLEIILEKISESFPNLM